MWLRTHPLRPMRRNKRPRNTGRCEGQPRRGCPSFLGDRMLKKFVVVAVTLLALGCNGKKEPTQEEAAQKRWNDARSSVLYSVAQDQYKSHDFDKCKQTVGQALKMTPNSAPLLVLAAKVDIEQGKLEQAENELEMARK